MNDGIIIIDKDAGLTSRNVDNKLGRMFNSKKVGHLGTLDPFATGLLIVGINKGTKYLQYIDDSRKTYVATLKLGTKTSTLDPEGEVIETKDVPLLTKETIEKVFSSFLGEGEQIPPMQSAIKIDGVPLYKKAHKGIEVERKPRKVFIYSLELISFDGGMVSFKTEVSRGTYIRTLGSDIAEKLGTIGYLMSLRRIKLGPFEIEEAKKIDSITKKDIVNGSRYLTSFKTFEIEDEEDAADVYNGRMLYVGEDLGERILICYKNEAIAIYKKVQDTLTYKAERGLF